MFIWMLQQSADQDRTTVVDECLRQFPEHATVAVLFYSFTESDHTAKSAFTSLIKQMIASFVDIGESFQKSFAAKSSDSLEKASGPETLTRL